MRQIVRLILAFVGYALCLYGGAAAFAFALYLLAHGRRVDAAGWAFAALLLCAASQGLSRSMFRAADTLDER